MVWAAISSGGLVAVDVVAVGVTGVVGLGSAR